MQVISHYGVDSIKTLLLGRRIVETSNNDLILDDGTILEIVPNQGGCICGAGDYELQAITKFDNVITDVEVKKVEDGLDTNYQLFVYSGGISTSVADITGDDGNGYYGTGFVIVVKEPNE